MDEASMAILGGGHGRLCGGDGDNDSTSAPPPHPWTRHGSMSGSRTLGPTISFVRWRSKPVLPPRPITPPREGMNWSMGNIKPHSLCAPSTSLVPSDLTSRPVDPSLLHSSLPGRTLCLPHSLPLFVLYQRLPGSLTLFPNSSPRLRQPLPPLSCHRSTSHCSP